MEPLSLVLLLVMGVLAGMINAAVGSGSLLTLPVLLAVGIPPGTAVRTNTVGMVASTIGSVLGFRSEIARERGQLGPIVAVSTLCAITGSLLLLVASADALQLVVPILILFALVMVLLQPRLTRWLGTRSSRSSGGTDAGSVEGETGSEDDAAPARRHPLRSPVVLVPMGAASVYGGFFTAAQGILYMGILSVGTGRSLKQVNPVKNLLSLVVNVCAALVYVLAHVITGAPIQWWAALAIAIGSLIGGFSGAHVAKRLPDGVLRAVIVVVALVALARQFI